MSNHVNLHPSVRRALAEVMREEYARGYEDGRRVSWPMLIGWFLGGSLLGMASAFFVAFGVCHK